VKGVALDVELGLPPALQQRVQLAHVGGADVALVGARVHGDAVGAGLQRQRGDVQHVRDASGRELRSSATRLTLTDSAVQPRPRREPASGATSGFIESVQEGVATKSRNSLSSWRVRSVYVPR
jgi:hypothetical protein